MEIKREKKPVIECCEICGGEILRHEALQTVNGTEEKVFTAYKQCSKCKRHYGTDFK